MRTATMARGAAVAAAAADEAPDDSNVIPSPSPHQVGMSRLLSQAASEPGSAHGEELAISVPVAAERWRRGASTVDPVKATLISNDQRDE